MYSTIEDLDSLVMVDLIMELESEFDIEIPDAELEHFYFISDIVDYIQICTSDKYIISDECINCGACEEECSAKAIYFDSDFNRYVIESDKCVGCGACEASCPLEAISKI